MIRINLLGVPKKTTRGGRRASTVAASGGGEGSSTVILGLIFAGALVRADRLGPYVGAARA